MFTGLIETVGTIARAERTGDGGMRLEVYAPDFGRDMTIGDSVAVDGACLTVVSFIRGAFLADLSEETVARTTLGRLRPNEKVNLERAMRLSDRLGGHMVTGHVDGIATFAGRLPAGNSRTYTFKPPVEVLPYIAEKGSIAVAGISLTVSRVVPNGFEVAVIPHTEETTTLHALKPGEGVNIEADMMAKYVRRFVAYYTGHPEDAGGVAEGRRGLSDMLKEFTDR
jgi:riboflavin synthase